MPAGLHVGGPFEFRATRAPIQQPDKVVRRQSPGTCRGRRDGRAHSGARLEADASRSAFGLAPEPAHGGRDLPRVRLPDEHLVGAGVGADLQRRLPDHSGGQTPPLPRPEGERVLGRHLARRRTALRERGEDRQGHLGGQPPARDGSVRIRGGDVLHLLLQPDQGRVGPGRRCPDHLHRDDGGRDRRAPPPRASRPRRPIRSGAQWKRGLPSRCGEPRRACDRHPVRRDLPARGRGEGGRASRDGGHRRGDAGYAGTHRPHPAPPLAPGRGQSHRAPGPGGRAAPQVIPAFPEGPGRWPPIRLWCCRSRVKRGKGNRRGS